MFLLISGISEDGDNASGAARDSTVKITEVKDTSDMSTQSDKLPPEGPSDDASGALTVQSETRDTNSSHTNSTDSSSDDADSASSNSSSGSEEQVDAHSEEANIEVVAFVDYVVAEAVRIVEARHNRPSHENGAQNGEYGVGVSVDVCLLLLFIEHHFRSLTSRTLKNRRS